MPNYQRGKIYKLVWEDTDEIYIGSTIQYLSARKGEHKSDYKRWKIGKKNKCSSSGMIDKYGDDFKIILIENFPCLSKDELLSREQYWIDLNKEKASNTCRAITSRKDIIECKCGGKYQKRSEYKHINQKNHQAYLNSLVEIEFVD